MRHLILAGLILALAAPVAAQPAAPAPSAAVEAKLAALKQEPSVRQVQEAALAYFRVNQDQVDSMRTRAGLKALAPALEVSGGFTRSELDEDTIMYEFSAVDPWVVRGAGGDAWDVRGKLTWDLPRLIFNSEQLDVASLAGLVEGILKESTRLYFMRRRLQVDMILNPPKDRATLIAKELRIDELNGLLDAMTGGWFQDQLDKTRVSETEPAPPATRRAATTAPAAPAAEKTTPKTLLARPKPAPVSAPPQ